MERERCGCRFCRGIVRHPGGAYQAMTKAAEMGDGTMTLEEFRATRRHGRLAELAPHYPEDEETARGWVYGDGYVIEETATGPRLQLERESYLGELWQLEAALYKYAAAEEGWDALCQR
jgi:hypothetical protein